MKKLGLLVLCLVMMFAMVGCGAGGSSDAPADLETAVFSSGDPESTYYNTVTIQYEGDKIYNVVDALAETHQSKNDEYNERLAWFEEWEEEAEGVPGYKVDIEINDLLLKSIVTIDMNEASMDDISKLWIWWETDKDYLSYEEVYDHFINESGFEVQE